MIRTSIFLILFLLAGLSAHAAKRYWVAASASTWNSTANWSSSSGGAGGSSVPTSSDTAYFDGNGTGNDTLDVNVSVKRLEIAAGYTGTIVQGTYTVTIGTSGAVLSGGTFAGGSGNITVSGAFTISGCAFTSTSGTLSTSANFTVSSGSFTHNNGTLLLNATSTLTISNAGGTTFYNLTFAPTVANSIFTITSTTTLTASNLLTIGGTREVVLNSGTINIPKDITITNTLAAGGGGTATIAINGTGKQILTGSTSGNAGRLPKVTINKSDTLVIVNKVSVEGGWTYSAGVIEEGTSTVYFGGGPTISGSHELKHVHFMGAGTYTIASGTTLTVGGTLILGSGGIHAVINTGTIHAKGNINVSGPTSTTGGGGTGKLVVNGTGDQTISGSTTFASARLCHVEINKPSGTLTITNYITAADDWTYTAGTISATSGRIVFSGNKTITGSHTLNRAWFMGSTTSTYTIASGTTLTLDSTLAIQGASTVNINTGTIHAKGNISLTNTSLSSGGSGTIVITGDSNQTVTGTTTLGQSRLPNVQINKSGGSITFVNKISVAGNWTYTAGHTIPGTSLIYFAETKTITGSDTLYDVYFSGGNNSTYTIASGTTLTVAGELNIAGTFSVTLNTGTIHAQGNIITTNSHTSSGGTATIVINGTGEQTLTGAGTAGQGKLPNVTVDKTSGTLTLNSVISVTGDWIYTRGTVSSGISSVFLYGNFNLDGQEPGSNTTMAFYTLQVASGTRTLTGNIDCNNNLQVASGATLVGGTYTLTVGGNWNSQGTWTYNTSTVVIDGGGDNQISGASGLAVDFYNLTFDHRSGYTTFSRAVTINHNMTLTKGRIISDTTNLLTFIDSATCTAANDSAYVHGPVRKIGDDAFTFPLGDTALHDSIAYHPLAMTAPGVNTDQFEAYYKAAPHTVGDSLVDSLAGVSQVEYWSLERKAGTSAVITTLGWNKNSTSIADLNTLRVGNWNGTKWLDLGAASITTNGYTGTITASVAPSYSVGSVAILAPALSKSNPPYALLKKKLDGGYYQAPNGRLYFRFDEEYNENGGNLRFNIYSDLNVLVTSDALTTVTTPWEVWYGDNRYSMNTLDCDFSPSGALTNGFYILEVINDKNERWYLRFKQTTSVTVTNCYSSPNAQ